MAGLVRQLSEKRTLRRTLRAPVAVTERMQRVDVGEVMREAGHELLAAQSRQMALAGELAEDAAGVLSMCCGRQNRSLLATGTVRSCPAQSYRPASSSRWKR